MCVRADDGKRRAVSTALCRHKLLKPSFDRLYNVFQLEEQRIVLSNRMWLRRKEQEIN